MSLQGANLREDSFKGAFSTFSDERGITSAFGSILGDVYEHSDSGAWLLSHGKGELSGVSR
jgi:hypothetical protein